jgi:hypothetical protein
MEQEVALSMVLEVVEEINRVAGVNIVPVLRPPYFSLCKPCKPAASRGRSTDRPPSSTQAFAPTQKGNPAAASVTAAPRLDDSCLEELKQIHYLLEQKVSKEQLRKRAARAGKRREELRRRLVGDFAESIRKEERARFKQERKRSLGESSSTKTSRRDQGSG